MGDLSGWSQSSGERRRLAAVIAGLGAGAVVGAALIDHARSWAPLFPLAVTALVLTAAARAFQTSKSSARPPARDSAMAPVWDLTERS